MFVDKGGLWLMYTTTAQLRRNGLVNYVYTIRIKPRCAIPLARKRGAARPLPPGAQRPSQLFCFSLNDV
jgi:hypothetical protein